MSMSVDQNNVVDQHPQIDSPQSTHVDCYQPIDRYY